MGRLSMVHILVTGTVVAVALYALALGRCRVNSEVQVMNTIWRVDLICRGSSILPLLSAQNL